MKGMIFERGVEPAMMYGLDMEGLTKTKTVADMTMLRFSPGVI